MLNDVPAKARNIADGVPERRALYPHMTVYDNMAFGLVRAQKIAKEVIDEQNGRRTLAYTET